MSQIEELQGRITAAMERIGTGLEALEAAQAAAQAAALANAGPDPEMVARLEEEKLANAQLEERLRAIKKKHGGEMAALTAAQAAQSEAMARLDMDVQRLRVANDQLRDSNAALRGANEDGVGEPDLINKAMLAELEGLRAARATDAAEADAVLSRLQPLLAAAADSSASGGAGLVEGEDE
jgi:chromosome segregation ATPase